MKISGTKDGAFWTITSLLYEAVSGQKNAALKKACHSVLRNIRSRELEQILLDFRHSLRA